MSSPADRMYRRPLRALKTAILSTLLLAPMASALESDRQQPLELDAGDWSGTLGDGLTTFRGGVEIRQGTLYIRAEEADVTKTDGRVSLVTFRGSPAHLEQEIEEQGLVQAQARRITYRVMPGVVELDGDADVTHPQYHITGALLTYDLNKQQFEGSSSDTGDGRISIRLDPEVAGEIPVPGMDPASAEEAETTPAEADEAPESDDAPDR